MNFNKFQELAYRTWNTGPTKEMQLLNCVIGICDEFGEVLEVLQEIEVNNISYDTLNELNKEVGDVYYYSAILFHLLDIKYGLIINSNKFIQIDIIILIARLQGAFKKHIFHGHELDLEDVEFYVAYILASLSALLKNYDSNSEYGMQLVIEKLEKRYPNGFNQKDSINRTA